jgi:tRNA pseudouridine38-40 synthase
MERLTYALALDYAGTGYTGWQRHPGRPTIQGALEEALASFLGERVQVHGAARTDAGVSAARQVASFSVRRSIEPEALLALPLPCGISLLAAARAPPGFHARASAAGKSYRYRYAWGEKPDPAAWFLGTDAAPRWEGALRALESLKRLAALSGLASPSTHRSAAPPLSAWSLEEGPGCAELTVSAPAFRKHEVRNLAGHLAAVALGLASADSLARLAGASRPWHGATAPAHGLRLIDVEYPAGLDPFRVLPAAQRHESGGLVEPARSEGLQIHGDEAESRVAHRAAGLGPHRDEP